VTHARTNAMITITRNVKVATGKRLPDDVAEFHTQTKVAKNDEWS